MSELKSLKDLYSDGLISVIKTDQARICSTSFIDGLKWYIFPKGTVFRHDVWYRIVQWSRINKIRKYTIGPVAYLIMRHYEYKYGVHISANMYVGKGLLVVHGDGVHLNCDYIGENFTVYQGVTLGTGSDKTRPTVLDNVTVYTNSVVCGGITLHYDCTVGAQSYLDKDVESGVVVAGVPAKVIKTKG